MANGLDLKCRFENLSRRGGVVQRHLTKRDKSGAESTLKLPESIDPVQATPLELFDIAWLRLKHRPPEPMNGARIRLMDLVAGCGGLSIGVSEECGVLELPAHSLLA